MGYHELDELGEKIQDIIDSAINEKNYQKLNQTINQTVNKAIDNGSEALRDALNNTFGGNSGKYTNYRTGSSYLGFSEEPDGHRPERTFRSMELHTEKFRQQPEAGTSCPIHAN